MGGILPLLPILSALGALGALAGGASTVAKNVIDITNAKNKLTGDKKKTEEIGVKGSGLYLKKMQRGFGLYLKKKKLSVALPKHALSNYEILNYIKQLQIPHFRGVFMRDKLPKTIKYKECGIVNLDSSAHKGTHWVAYKKHGNTVNYFDSFGQLKPSQELVRYFGSNVKILYNKDRYQKFNTYNCGHLCIEFLYNVIE